jgi:hypothetical protein
VHQDALWQKGCGGEQLDRAPVIKGEIRLGDRIYMQPDRIAALQSWR